MIRGTGTVTAKGCEVFGLGFWGADGNILELTVVMAAQSL